jgi:hypothetical protein
VTIALRVLALDEEALVAGMSASPPIAHFIRWTSPVGVVPDPDMSRRREVAHKYKQLFRPAD